MPEPVQPDPQVYPVCGHCSVAYVLRRVITFSPQGRTMTTRSEWIWQRDCNGGRRVSKACKDAEAVLVDNRKTNKKAKKR